MNNQSRGIRKPFPYTFRNFALILIGINVTVFFLTMLIPDLKAYLALNPVLFLRNHFYWTPLTYMFTHSGMNHILFNMLGLFFFGPQLEERMGSWEFLTFYLGTGFLSGLLSLGIYIFTGFSRVFLLGASGAIFALLFAFAVYFPHSRIYLFGIIPMKTTMMVSLYAGIEIFSLVFGVGGNVAHMTHLAGLLFAWLYFVIRLGIDPVRSFKDSRNNPWH